MTIHTVLFRDRGNPYDPLSDHSLNLVPVRSNSLLTCVLFFMSIMKNLDYELYQLWNYYDRRLNNNIY